MRNRLIRSCTVVLFGSACLAHAAVASAQAQERFALDQFDPAPAGDRFFGVQGGDPGGHVNPRVMLLGEYAYRPLVLFRNDGDERVASVVSDQLFAHLSVGLGLWKDLSLSANLPLALVTAGDSPSAGGLAFSSPSGAALGDLRLAARYRLVGTATGADFARAYIQFVVSQRDYLGLVFLDPSLVRHPIFGPPLRSAREGVVTRLSAGDTSDAARVRGWALMGAINIAVLQTTDLDSELVIETVTALANSMLETS